MTLGNSPDLAGRGAYLAVANSGGHDSWDVHNADYKVVRNTPELVELSFGCRIGGVHFTQHFVVRRGEPGFYVFIQEQRGQGDPPEQTGQARWSFYLNESVFNYQLASDTEQGPIPDMTGAEMVQDATFRLKDGSIYTKYNYCTYVEEDYVHGLCGTNPGSYGAFVITPGHEWLQAPTKQYITVHAIPILHQMLQTGHFIPRELASQPIPEGWNKLCGPWFVYLNRGDSRQQIWADAKARADKEKAVWPYAWMRHPDYPLQRGEVSGKLKLYNGSQPAANALMVLTAPQPDWQLQVLNYIFSVRADGNGHFTLPNVRPGNYTLFAAVPGVTDEFRKDNITVAADGKVDLGTIVFTPAYYSAKLWEIGFADRRTTGFRLSDQPRQYGLDKTVPAELTYRVGSSDPSRDWYYCQGKPGDWRIKFNLDQTYQGQGVLTLGIAGQTSDPILQVLVNRKPVGTYSGGNSSASYRSAILGSSYYEEKIFRFPASLLQRGTNTVTLGLNSGSSCTTCAEAGDRTIPTNRSKSLVPCREANHDRSTMNTETDSQTQPSGTLGEEPMIKLQNIEKSYQTKAGSRRSLRQINLDIAEGEFITIMGPSGAGKSTLLGILGHVRPCVGRGVSVPRSSRASAGAEGPRDAQQTLRGVCFPAISSPRQPHSVGKSRYSAFLPQHSEIRAARAGGRRAGPFWHRGEERFISQPALGGQQQLVAVARAIIAKPELLLADEPTGNLHTDQGREIMELFKKLNQEGTTIVQVTHNEAWAAYGHRIIRLKDGWMEK